MKTFLTHKLSLYYDLNALDSSFNQKVYECDLCKVKLYEHFTLDVYFEVDKIYKNGMVSHDINGFNLNCTDYIIKNIIE